MADLRAKHVLGELADLYSRSIFALDLPTQLDEPLSEGDSVEIPSIGALTVNENGATAADPEAVSNTVLTLVADRHPWINVQLPAVSRKQNMDGKWAEQVAKQATIMLKNRMDEHLLRDYLAREIAYDASATYHVNVEGDALTEDDLLNGRAELLTMDGVQDQNIVLACHPFGVGSIMSIAGFVPNGKAAEEGRLGIPLIGSVFGTPVVMTNSVLRNLTIATSAVTVASNVATATIPSGHGLVPGMRITTTGLTTNVATPTAILTSGATSVTFALTAADGALADGVGSIVSATCQNLLMDKANVFVAQQQMPTARIVQDPRSTGDNLQIAAIWGRRARAGYVRVLHSPGSRVA